MNYKYDNTDKEFQELRCRVCVGVMRNDFTLFKNFNISFNMYSYIGHKKTLGRFTNDNALLNVTNQIKRDYWTPENRNNEYPRLANKNLPAFRMPFTRTLLSCVLIISQSDILSRRS